MYLHTQIHSHYHKSRNKYPNSHQSMLNYILYHKNLYTQNRKCLCTPYNIHRNSLKSMYLCNH